jgi:hypothetical protein
MNLHGPQVEIFYPMLFKSLSSHPNIPAGQTVVASRGMVLR